MADNISRPGERLADRRDLGDFLQRVLIVAGIVVLGWILWSCRHVLLLVFLAVLFACALDGLANAIRKRVPVGSKAAVGAAGLIILGTLAGVLYFFGQQIGAQLATLGDALPGAWAGLRDGLEQTEFGRQAVQQARSAASGDNLLGDLVRRAGRFGFSFASGALDAFLVLVAAVFLALNPASYRDGLLRLTPSALRGDAREAFDTSGLALKKWLGGTLLSMVAMTLMVGLGLWALGVPAPIALALIAGVAQFVPFVGPILAAAPAILLGLTLSPATALWVALLYFVASTIEANLLYPLIQKRAVQQPPVLTLFTVIAFGVLLGPLGAVLAVPLTVVATVFLVIFYIRGVLREDMKAPGERGKS